MYRVGCAFPSGTPSHPVIATASNSMMNAFTVAPLFMILFVFTALVGPTLGVDPEAGSGLDRRAQPRWISSGISVSTSEAPPSA
jgi:hypothetical protein